jgi:hypothetical protein
MDNRNPSRNDRILRPQPVPRTVADTVFPAATHKLRQILPPRNPPDWPGSRTRNDR